VSSFNNYINYYRFIKAVPETIIDNLIKRFECEKLENGLVDNGNFIPEKRISKIYWIPKNDEYKNLYEIICKYIARCNSDFYQFKLYEMKDCIQYSVYTSEDSGFYEWHVDLGKNNMRKLTCVVQLSDPSEYEGGELQINNGNIVTVEKEEGTVIIFPSYLLHRVTPVTRGKRRSLVCWIEGPAFI
jgi:PKHD-type hydroxylase